MIVGLLAAVFMGASYTSIRRVNYEFHPLIAIFYFNLATALASAVMHFINQGIYHKVTHYTFGSLIILAIMAISGFLSQLFISVSYKYEKAGRVATMRYV
jgi:drug/metabolite transporter (DMT)-like permease